MVHSSLLLGALADDFTGAVELAAMLQAGRARTRLVIGADTVPVDPIDADAVVVALRTRVAPPAEAVAASKAAAVRLRALGSRQLFLKYCASFDSLDTGNIGNVTEMLRSFGNAAPVLFCPTFPEAGRAVFRGHMFIGMQLLGNSPKRLDPLTPMTKSNLVEVLAPQTTLPVGVLPLEVVAQGEAAVRAYAEAEHVRGVPFLIADAILERDLQIIAGAAVDWPLLTGNSNVVSYLPALWRERGWIPDRALERLPAVAGPGAVLAGSCADRTREQVAVFERSHPVLRLDPLDVTEARIEEALAWAVAWMPHGPFCITTSDDPARVAAAQQKYGAVAAGRMAEALLARLGAGLVQRGVRRLLVAGGETSGAVVQALGITSLQVAPYREMGVGRCWTDEPVPLALCLKSGKLGSPDMFAQTLIAMETAA